MKFGCQHNVYDRNQIISMLFKPSNLSATQVGFVMDILVVMQHIMKQPYLIGKCNIRFLKKYLGFTIFVMDR